MNAIYTAGRGDSVTWPKCEGHPNDPRTKARASDELAESIRIAIVRCEEALGRADRALDKGDTDAAQDLLASAMKELAEVATLESTT